MRKHRSHPYAAVGFVLSILLVLAGCASTAPVPDSEMAEARTVVKQAEDLGARELAPVEYRRAQKKLEDAQAAIARDRNAKARRLAEQAAVDAELASVKARSAKTQAAVRELQESIRVLRDEMERKDSQRSK